MYICSHECKTNKQFQFPYERSDQFSIAFFRLALKGGVQFSSKIKEIPLNFFAKVIVFVDQQALVSPQETGKKRHGITNKINYILVLR